MKKIFIMAHAMELGGAEKALLGILENLDYTKYQVDLFLLRHEGDLLQYIPDTVNILPENSQYASLGVPIVSALKKKQFKIVLYRVISKVLAKKRIKELHFEIESNVINEYSHKYIVKALSQINDVNYDIAISFVSPHYFVAEKVKAKKKIAWIHTDYATLKVDINSEKEMWSRYDDIISISEDVSNSFLKTFPELKAKIRLIENIIPIKYMNNLIEQLSVEKEMPPFKGKNVLSIGRFSPPKKFTDVPELCRKIGEKGVNVRWYLIGFGMEETLIRQQIVLNGMEDRVFILGKKDNPYPYIKACDVYAQPSRYEGKSIAVREAQILNKPVIITDYLTAKSQVRDGYDGVVVPMDIDACAQAIADCIGNDELLKKLSENTRNGDYIHSDEIRKLYEIMESV